MADDKKKEADDEEDDGRIAFLCSFTIKSLRLKIEKWQKMMSNDEYKVRENIKHFNKSV
jgi:hypothetical protein